MEFIDLGIQYIKYKNQIDARIDTVLKHGRFIMGPEVLELENTLSNYVGVKHCIAVASGTDSLEIALRSLGIGIGDEVITVPFSWISTVEVIVAVGATPVFIDIDRETYNMDPDLLEQAITNDTKCIIPVSLFGQMPNIEQINAIAEKYDIPVIEDAAQSFGATRNDKRSCSTTTIASTSFFPAKPLGCYGDGGALFTNNAGLAETMKAIRSHGGTKRHHHTHIGMNGRLDTLQAAILLGKWPHFEEEVISRNKIGGIYSKLLEGYVETPKVFNGNTHVYAQYTIRVNEHDRSNILKKMKERGIPVGIYYPKCFHEQPVFHYLGYDYGDFPESEKASREVLSLPMHPFLKKEEQEKVTKNLIDILKSV